jgi:hypothetical protein
MSNIRVFAHSPSIATSPIAAYTLAPQQGSITRVGCIVNGSFTTDCSVAVKVNGTAIGGSPFTITASGSAAGTNGSTFCFGPNAVNEDDQISFTPSGSTGANVTGSFYAIVRKSFL